MQGDFKKKRTNGIMGFFKIVLWTTLMALGRHDHDDGGADEEPLPGRGSATGHIAPHGVKKMENLVHW
jgi:spore coat protein CotH